MLFNLYMADVGRTLEVACLAPPRIGQVKIHILQYADDLVLLDQTKVGLQRALNALDGYNQKNQLVLNIAKTKIITFGKYPHKTAARWQVGHQSISPTPIYNN